MLKTIRTALALGLLAAGLAIGAGLGPAAAATRNAAASDLPDFEGPVVAINRDAQTFKVRDHHAGVVKIKVNKETRYEHLSGFGALRNDLRVDVEARRSGNRWIAVHVEREND